MQKLIIILIITIFLSFFSFFVHRYCTTRRIRKSNDAIIEIMKDTSEFIEREIGKQINGSLMSPIDYIKGTRKPKKGE